MLLSSGLLFAYVVFFLGWDWAGPPACFVALPQEYPTLLASYGVWLAAVVLLCLFHLGVDALWPKVERADRRRVFNDMVFVLLLGALFVALAGLRYRVWGQPQYFFPLLALSTALYTRLFYATRAHVVLGAGQRGAGVKVMLVLGAAFVLGLAVLVRLCYSAYFCGMDAFIFYLVLIAVIVAVHLVLFLPCGTLHVHHWYWPIPLMFLTTNTGLLACAMQALLLAIHVHGVANYGLKPLHEDVRF